MNTAPRRLLGVFLAMVLASSLVACGGGASSSLPSGSTAQAGPSGPIATTVELVIPSKAVPSSTLRKAQFISPATMSASIAVTGVGTTVVNLSPSSNACVAGSDSRVCTTSVLVPAGSQTFTVTTYDASPLAGAIPLSAHVLGLGTATQVISGTSGAVTIEIEAVVDGFASLPAEASVPADGAIHTYQFAMNPVDFDDDPITNTASDPYHNPITVTLSESGGSGHAVLMIGGSPSGSTGTLTNATQSLGVQYDGAGSVGYAITVTFSATGVGSMQTVIAPMFVTSVSPLLTGFQLTLGGTATSAPMVVQEAAPYLVPFTVTASNCTSIATVSALISTGIRATTTITGGATSSASGCTVTFSDGISSIPVDVANGVPTPTPSPSPTPGPPYIYVNTGGQYGPIETFAVSEISPSPAANNIAPLAQFTTSISTTGYNSMALDSLHNILWMTTQSFSIVGYPPSTTGSSVVASDVLTTGQIPQLVAVDASGNVYVEAGGFPHVWIYMFPYGSTSSGTILETPLEAASGLAVDANGFIYVGDLELGEVCVFAPPGFNAGVTYETASRTLSGFTQTGAVALDSTGRVYVIDNGGSAAAVKIFAAGIADTAPAAAIETISGSNAIPFTVTSPFESPSSLTLDASNNLYLTDYNTVRIFDASAITGALGGTLSVPSATLSGSNTLFSNATGIVVH